MSLADGWCWATIGELAEVNPQKVTVDLSDEAPVPFVPMAAVEAEFGGIDVSATRPLGEVRRGYRQFRQSDVLFAKITPCMENGKLAIVPEIPAPVGYGSTEFYVLRTDPGVAPWLAHYLSQRTFRADAQASMQGAAGQLRVPKAWLAAKRMPVAPLAEQRRVVGKLDDMFSELDAGVAALERAQANLERYRASVLKAAVEGRLTAAWRSENPPEETGEELLERILVERRERWEMEQLAKYEAKGKKPPTGWKAKYKEPGAPNTSELPELPKGWSWATLDALIAGIDAGKNFRCIERPPAEGEVGVLKVSAVSWGEFRPNESKTCDRPEMVNPVFFVRPGDLLVSRANTIELVGACVLVTDTDRDLMLSDKTLRLRSLQGLEPWIVTWLRSPQGRREITSRATGNQESMRNISQANLRRVAVPLPPAREIRRVRGVLERLDEARKGQRASVGRAQRTAEALRRSILRRAFEGHLVPQDPSDEPAAVLLERISAEREAVQPTKKRRSQKSKPDHPAPDL